MDTYFDFPGLKAIDDVLVLLLGLLATFRLARLPATPILAIAVWLAVLMLAAYTSVSTGVLPLGETLTVFRQVALPAVLVLAGMSLGARGLEAIAPTVIRIGLANAAYCFFEIMWDYRPIDPGLIAIDAGIYLGPEGLPGNYFVYTSNDVFVRAGGLYLNPPSAGIVTAVGGVLALYRGGRRGVLTSAVLAGATVATFSRAGILIYLAGTILPPLVRRFGLLLAGLLALPLAISTGALVGSTKGTLAHIDGARAGLADSVSAPGGRGFGYAGNQIAHLGTVEASESLAGIAFSAGGLLLVGIYAIAMKSCVSYLRNSSDARAAAVALGALTAALLAETAGSITTTVPLWLIVGYSFAINRNPTQRTLSGRS